MPWHLLRTRSSLYPNILSYITRLKEKEVFFLSLQKLLDSGKGSGGTLALAAPSPTPSPVVWRFVKGLI